jgi:catechol 2,3-dioxygenase-like lactoylglutathione lyase family enzyme
MSDVEELRLVLTVSDFEAAVELYRDALGLAELADWSEGDAKIVVLDAGRATVEVGSRVSGPVRIAFKCRTARRRPNGSQTAAQKQWRPR